jgi:regulator of protease activity HflC (stomatin/prohibitin superfamily)
MGIDNYYEYKRQQQQQQKERKNMSVKAGFGIGALVLAALVGITVVGGSFYTIDQGERGVLLRNGAATGVAEPGLGFKMPIIDSVVQIDVREQARVYENLLAYSKDQQTAGITVSVNYRVPAGEVATVYEDYGSVESLVSRVLDRQVNEELKNVFGRFNAVSAIQDRTRLNAEVQTAIQAAVTGPILISSVQVENIDFSDAYENSIEERMLAEVEVQKIEQNASREEVQARILVIQAVASADARVAQATAEAAAVRLAGDAEADAIRAKGSALRDNPALVDLITAENWNGELPTTMLPGSTVPFINTN